MAEPEVQAPVQTEEVSEPVEETAKEKKPRGVHPNSLAALANAREAALAKRRAMGKVTKIEKELVKECAALTKEYSVKRLEATRKKRVGQLLAEAPPASDPEDDSAEGTGAPKGDDSAAPAPTPAPTPEPEPEQEPQKKRRPHRKTKPVSDSDTDGEEYTDWRNYYKAKYRAKSESQKTPDYAAVARDRLRTEAADHLRRKAWSEMFHGEPYPG